MSLTVLNDFVYNTTLTNKTDICKIKFQRFLHKCVVKLFFVYTIITFADKVREANGCVLIHCLAGISRSATIAIAYVMHVLGMTSDEAYRSVFKLQV